MSSFLSFLREQGVVGLAVGFILGGSITTVITSFVDDIMSPILGLLLRDFDGLEKATLQVGGATVQWGSFAVVLLDFLLVAFVVYVVVQVGLGRLQRERQKGTKAGVAAAGVSAFIPRKRKRR